MMELLNKDPQQNLWVNTCSIGILPLGSTLLSLRSRWVNLTHLLEDWC